MTSVGWGILGTGRMAEWFCSDFGSVPNGRLAAVASRTSERAQGFADQFGIPSAYGSYAEMLADDDLDVIYIATPHKAHKANILQAVAAGRAVVCEKPFVTTVADGMEVVAAAKAAGVYVTEALWTWHLPAMKQARAWVDEGRIGRLVHVKADFGYPVAYSPDQREYDAKAAGGALREMGIYPLAIGRYFIGRDPTSIQVVHQTAPNGVEHDLTALFDYGDVTAVLATSYRCRMRNAAYIIGEEGYIVLPDAFRAQEASLFQLDQLVDNVSFPRLERGYHYQAAAIGEDLAAGRTESLVVPLDASLAFQRDMATILARTGRGEHD